MATLLPFLCAVTLVPVSARAETTSAPPAVWAADRFIGIDHGLLGCVRNEGWLYEPENTREWCFVAHDITEGPDAGDVRVVIRYDEWDRDLLPRTHEPQVFEEVLPAGTLVWSGRTLTFSGRLDSLGVDVDLDFPAHHDVSERSTYYGSCWPAHPLDAQMESMVLEPTITIPYDVRGTIGDEAVDLASSNCNYLVRGETAGFWSMNTITY